MDNKKDKKHISLSNAAPNAPRLSMPIFGERLYLAAHAIKTDAMIYSLSLPWDKDGVRIIMQLQPMLYSFDSMDARDKYMAALKHVMRFQHATPTLSWVIKSYDDEIKKFNATVAKIHTEQQR